MLSPLKRKVRRILSFRRTVPVFIPVIDSKNSFKGKTAIVTGGGSGIGLCIAKRLVTSGCNVYILGRNEQVLRQRADEIGCHYKVLDILDVKSIESVVKVIFAESPVHILVNCAGALSGKNFGETDFETWEKVFNTNARGTYFMTQIVTNQMKEQRIKGHVLNISSSSALRPCYNIYNISKHVVKEMTVGFAKMLIPYGIVVNGIAPGPTATAMIEASEEDISQSGVPAGRYATADEIANYALMLLSDAGNMVVGSTLYITGGSGVVTRE